MENQSNQPKAPEKGKRRRSGGIKFLHLLQHLLFVTAVLLVMVVLNRSYVVVDTLKGAQVFKLR